MPKAKEIGKFIYIEPNDLYGNKPYNAIPQPYEDYSMAVDLQVEIPSRDSCGDPNTKRTLYFSSDNGTISFFGGSGGGDGKQGFLTTNFTDISPMNVGKGNKETLGISSINITYDSWFFPVVTINFVDVRGASLMMPQEYAYRTAISNNKEDITQIEGGSFFKALFSFPYPLFKLTVKGFYGGAAVYNLAVKDFKASFNSESGNFECVAQFIGYMFGVYTDIPMTYLAAAPYIGRGTDTKYGPSWLSSNFRFHNENENGEEQESVEMCTFPEFKLLIDTANKNLDKIVASTQVGLDISEIRKKKSALNSIKNLFNNLGFIKAKDTKFDNQYWYYFLTEKLEDTDIAERIIKLKKAVDDFCAAKYSESDSGSLQRTLKPVFDLLDGENDNKKVKIDCSVYVDEDNSSITHLKKITLTLDSIRNALLRISKEDKETFDNKTKSFLNENKVCYVVSFCLTTDFVDYLDKQDAQYEKKNRDFEMKLQQERLKAFQSVLGFYPSIKNIFDMTFAHMETFVKEYYNMLDEVRDKMEHHLRKPETFGFHDESQTDFRIYGVDNPSDSTKPSEKQVPPFPLFVQEVIENDGTKIKRVVGPWEFNTNNMEMPEMQFVIKLLNASKFYSEEARRINELIEQTNEAQGSILPSVEDVLAITLYDFVHQNSNPYQSVQFMNGSDKDRVYQILLTYFLRWYYYSISSNFDKRGLFGWDDRETKCFAQLEAYNLQKALPKITQSIRTILLESNADKKLLDEFFSKGIDYFNIGGKNTLFTTTKKGSDEIITYNWLGGEGNKKILPIGEFNVNSIKTDMGGEYASSDKYAILSVDGSSFDFDDNKLTCKIDDKENLFEETISVIKNADDGVGDYMSEGKLKSIQDASIFTKSTGNNKVEAYINKGKIFTTGKGKKTYNVFNGSSTVGGVQMTTVTEEVENTYTVRELNEKEGSFTEEESEKLRVISGGTAINGDFSKQVFDNDVFKAQKNNRAKAYLFVLSLPLDPSIFLKGQHLIKNGTTLKSMILREGAYYWRYNEMRPDVSTSNPDPIIIPEGYKSITEDVGSQNNPETYIYITEKDKTLNFVSKSRTDSNKYIKFTTTEITKARKNAVIEKFTNFADCEFPEILRIVERRPTDYFNDSEYQRIMVQLLKKFISIVDETPQGTTKFAKPTRSQFENAFKKFVNNLKDLYKGKDDLVVMTTESNLADGTDIINDKDIMLSTYLVLKSLYDKWFCGMDKRTWFIEYPKSDFKNFKYIDSYYNDIGHKLVPSVNTTLSILDDYMPAADIMQTQESTQYAIRSMHEFLSENCEKMGVYFKSLPLMYGLNCNDIEKIDMMFDAIPFSKYISGKGLNDGQCYICMYTYKPSEHLDIRDDNGQYDYLDDSFDIADINGESSKSLPVSLYEVGKNTIPAFGVTYAAQGQSYFKNISVSMENPMQTEASIATTMALASKATDGPREIALYGQDLYRVYSNYSYTCTVDMMGNSQVVPMMYFQLNNIPMFRGAYMITKVEHNITAGNMTTKFTGVRQNKNATPLIVNGSIIACSEDGSSTQYDGRVEGEVIGGSVSYGGEGTGYAKEKTKQDVNRNYKSINGVFDCDAAIKGMYESKRTTQDPKVTITAMNNVKSKFNCAGFVRMFMEDGGINTDDRPRWASQYIDWLPTKGFHCLTILKGMSQEELKQKTKEICERGDIAVMNHVKSDGNNYGHICMWNDISQNWVCDFKQSKGPWPYGKEKPNYIYIFRFGPDVGKNKFDIGHAKRKITSDFDPTK